MKGHSLAALPQACQTSATPPRRRGHAPSSTMMSPSLREAPCPAQILFIWATRARLAFSPESSSSLAAGLQTHPPQPGLPLSAWLPSRQQGQRKIPGGATD